MSEFIKNNKIKHSFDNLGIILYHYPTFYILHQKAWAYIYYYKHTTYDSRLTFTIIGTNCQEISETWP
jgi:hypothetical protein